MRRGVRDGLGVGGAWEQWGLLTVSKGLRVRGRVRVKG